MRHHQVVVASILVFSTCLWVGVHWSPDAPAGDAAEPCPEGIGLRLHVHRDGVSVDGCPALEERPVAGTGQSAGGTTDPYDAPEDRPRLSRLAAGLVRVVLRVALELLRPESRLMSWQG